MSLADRDEHLNAPRPGPIVSMAGRPIPLLLLHGSEWADLDVLCECYGFDSGCARETMPAALWAAVVELPGPTPGHVGIDLLPRSLISEFLLAIDLSLLDMMETGTVDRLAQFQRTMAPLHLALDETDETAGPAGMAA